MILVVDLNWKANSLAFNEFVLPIISSIKPLCKFEVKHFSELKPRKLDSYSKVVLSGTALKDHTTLKKPEKLAWISDFDRPILGICAGMQTMSLLFGEKLSPCLQVGMTEISTLKQNSLFEGKFQAYALHNFSVKSPKMFEVLAKSSKCIQAIKHNQKSIFGVLFHPEVRNQEILRRFIELPKQ